VDQAHNDFVTLQQDAVILKIESCGEVEQAEQYRYILSVAASVSNYMFRGTIKLHFVRRLT
jgi:hypothetical protein